MENIIEVIREMAKQGKPWREIAEKVKRSISWVRLISSKNGIKKEKVNRRRWSDKQMIEAIKSSYSFASVLRKLGLSVRPGNYPTLRNFIKTHEISISHMDPFGHKSSQFKSIGLPLGEILVDNSTYSSGSLKRRLIKSKILKNKCSICGCSEWNGKPLKTILDHINGKNNDHRIENLRMLCPNCNSQQETFCRGGRKISKIRHSCPKCGAEIYHTSKQCLRCSILERKNPKKPSAEVLSSDIKTMSWVAIGKKYGVSDNAVRKWARRYGILA